MTNKLYQLICLLPALLWQPDTSAATTGVQSHDSILQAAQDFMESHSKGLHDTPAEIRTGRLDSRLRLAQCEAPLETFLPPGGRTLGNTTVGVRCSIPKPWTLYVPVTVNLYKQVVVAADALPRGTILQRDQVKAARRNLAKLPQGYFIDPERLVGMKLKRNVAGGLPLSPTMVAAPQVIKRGQRVTLVANTGSVAVTMSGKALANGAAGERIRVKNLSSKRIIEGLVTSSGEVIVGI